MQSWPTPEIPTLPGKGLPLRLYDTSTGEVRPVAPGDPARMYVCGITPYDATHLGHAATYLAFDVIGRNLRDTGLTVDYVQNVTDIDDPLLERAVATGQDWRELARRETELFCADMTALSVIPPTSYIGAVEAMPLICEAIERLRQADGTYYVDGDLYFDLTADPHFGSVAGLDVHTMAALAAERGGDPDRSGKRNPLDPMLWQAARPDEPAWDTKLGHGRPGWHIECVAIALDKLGMTFDIQGGGRDLAFPHHEMGSSQAAALTGEFPYARHYVHCGLVGYQGHKMSKSRGNLVFVSTLLAEGVDPSALRMALLSHHYRDDWEWHDRDLIDAQARLERWRSAFARGRGPSAQPVLARMRERISDDLDTPAALAAVDEWADRVLANRGEHTDAPDLVATSTNALLGINIDPVTR